MDRDPFDLVGDTLDGQFRVVAFAGEGDLTVVYKGHNVAADAPVAIKCLDLPGTLDGAMVRPLVEGFHEAARIHAKLARGNLNIAQSVTSGSTLARATGMIVPYLVREWLLGESLRVSLEQRRGEGKSGRPVEEVVALLEPAVDALSYAHAQGTPHLAFHPSNLFLADRAGKSALKVLDFGVARAMNELARTLPPASRPAAPRELFPAYAAPEQLDAGVGEVGARSDVYALALVMMELLSDRVVMGEQDRAALVGRALDEQRRPVPRTHGLELPRNLDLVLTRAVARAPERRQKHATDFWNDVKTSLRGGSTSRGMSAPRPPARPTATLAGTAPPPTVAGAVPSRRLLVPVLPSTETIPMGFDPRAAAPASVPQGYLPVPVIAAIEQEPEQAPVHVVAIPPPPQAATPALPPVIVAVDSPLPIPAPPPPPPPAPPAPDRVAAEPPGAGSPSPTFPIIDEPRVRRRSRPLVALAVATVVGASLGVALVIYVKKHGSTQPTPVTSAASTPPPPASSSPPSPSASASTSPVTSAAAPPSSSAPDDASAPPGSSSGAAPLAHFPAGTAKLALDAAGKEIAHCKRGKVWGIGSANVTFGNDGAVNHVAVSVPFTGTTTAQCVSDALEGVRVAPYAGKPGVVTVRFFVPPK